MKLQEALRKVIRQFGGSVIQEKRLMSFLADYKAFDDYPAVKEVMRAIATGDWGKELCRLATDASDADYLRYAESLKETLVRERNFKQEFADYAVDSISLAIGVSSQVTVTEPGDHGYEAVRKNTGEQGSRSAQEKGSAQGGSTPPGGSAERQKPAPGKESPRTVRTVSGDPWQTASEGAESHRRFYRGKDLTSAFDDGTFSRSVADGSFRDILPGDFITKEITVPGTAGRGTETYTVKFIIADLDIALNQGSSGVTQHHAVIVPEGPVFDSCMNPTDTNKGGYAGSYMNKTVMPAFARGLAGAFGTEHLLRCSFDGSGRASSDPLSCTCRLMTLSMVFGQAPLPDSGLDWSCYIKDSCMGGNQLAAFSLHPELRGHNRRYWVSDSCSWSSSAFAIVIDFGGGVHAIARYASSARVGVRPFALLV